MSGILYLCATPIGNLEDMTLRALRVLNEVDLIAAEDTRNSIKLLNHFEIETPMTSYHEHNKIEKGHYLIERLLSGENIALITDAGMPGISDPGEELVKMAYAAGVGVTVLPGACACVTALTLSGQTTGRFCFEAFLPTDKRKRAELFCELREEYRTIVLYEAPHRLLKTLRELLTELGERRLSVCKELTKKHEGVFITTLSEAIAYYSENEPKGEYVLVIEGKDKAAAVQKNREEWLELSIEEHMELYLSQGMDKKTAMKAVSVDRGVPKREIYNAIMK